MRFLFVLHIDWGVVASALTVVSVILGAAWAFYQKVILKHIITPLKQNTADTEEIKKELTTNGGKSLKDEVKKLTTSANAIEKRLIISEINNSKQAGIYKSITYSIHLGHFISDQSGRMIEVGVNMCKIWDRTDSQLLGMNWLSWVWDEDKDRVRFEWEIAIEEQRDFDIEFRCVRASDKKLQKVRIIAFRVEEYGGKFSGLVGTVHAIGKPINEGDGDLNPN